jgi:hypothetical protein
MSLKSVLETVVGAIPASGEHDPAVILRVDNVLDCGVDIPDSRYPTLKLWLGNNDQSVYVKLSPAQIKALGKALIEASREYDDGSLGTFEVIKEGVVCSEFAD